MTMRVDERQRIAGVGPRGLCSWGGAEPRGIARGINRWALGALLLLASCGDDGGGDFPGDGPCWPIQSSLGGSVEIGTGDLKWMAIQDTVPIVQNVSQSDPYVEVHSRMSGMPAGDAYNPFDPKNPRTKVSVVIDELGLTLGVECPASLGYLASPEAGTYDLVHSLRVGFGTYPVEQAVGKQARITLEVVGSNRRYARDEKTVTLVAQPP